MKSQVLLITLITLLSGCATIVSKSRYPVYIHADPKGTNISITDRTGKEVYKGITPATITLSSGAGFFTKAEYQVKLSLPGYDEKVVPIYFKINGWYFGNIVFGGFIGMLIVDPATGAMWKLVDPAINETMVKSALSTNLNPTLNIVDIKSIPNDERVNLVRVN